MVRDELRKAVLGGRDGIVVLTMVHLHFVLGAFVPTLEDCNEKCC